MWWNLAHRSMAKPKPGPTTQIVLDSKDDLIDAISRSLPRHNLSVTGSAPLKELVEAGGRTASGAEVDVRGYVKAGGNEAEHHIVAFAKVDFVSSGSERPGPGLQTLEQSRRIRRRQAFAGSHDFCEPGKQHAILLVR